MIVLHAGYRAGRLMVWGESEPGRNRAAFSPFDAGRNALAEALTGLGVSGNFDTAAILLPTVRKQPVPSSPLIAPVPEKVRPRLVVWNVTVAELAPVPAVELLAAYSGQDLLRPGVVAGADFVYWAMALRFAGALTARQQFLPDLVREEGRFRARWTAAPLGRDDERRAALLAPMPGAARVFAPDVPASTLLGGFLNTVIDTLVRQGTALRIR